jgi:hypothetical protein
MKAGMRARFRFLGAWSWDDDFGRLIEERGELIRPIDPLCLTVGWWVSRCWV